MESFSQNPEAEKHSQRSTKWLWLVKILAFPKKVFHVISESQKPLWVLPMAILSVSVIVLSLMGGPIRLSEAQMKMSQLPDDSHYWSEEQRNQFFEGQQALQSPLFIYIFPIIGSLGRLWLGWYLMGGMMFLLMTFKGSHNSQKMYLNFVAWAAVPFILRNSIRIGALAIGGHAITNPGLSGFIPADAQGWQSYFRIFISLIDFYSIWFMVLLIIGSPIISGLNPNKALGMTLVAVLIFLILTMIPDLISNQVSGLGTIQPFLFF